MCVSVCVCVCVCVCVGVCGGGGGSLGLYAAMEPETRLKKDIDPL